MIWSGSDVFRRYSALKSDDGLSILSKGVSCTAHEIPQPEVISVWTLATILKELSCSESGLHCMGCKILDCPTSYQSPFWRPNGNFAEVALVFLESPLLPPAQNLPKWGEKCFLKGIGDGDAKDRARALP